MDANSTPTPNAITDRKPLSIFLTGATTTLGQVLTKRLTAAGHQVTGLAPSATGGALVRAHGGLPAYADPSRAGELKGLMSLRKIEIVINVAPQAANHVPLRNADWQLEALEANTQALIEAASSAGAAYLLHLSYAFVYGDHRGHMVDETSAPEPGDHALLKGALRIERSVLGATVAAGVLRLGYTYGAESSELSALGEAIRANRPIVSGDGIANWVHLDDAAEAVRRAAEAQKGGRIYNVVDNTPASSTAFVNAFAKANGLREPARAPKFLAALLLNPTQIALMQLSVKVSNALIKHELGWSPRFASHVAGLDDVLLSWRAAAV